MNVNGKHYRAVWWQHDEQKVAWIHQGILPFRFQIEKSNDPEVVAAAIERMEVRGAPSIGAFAALGLALAALHDEEHFIDHWLPRFRQTRPTAVNLFHACDAMQKAFGQMSSPQDMLQAAQVYCDTEVERSHQIGVHLAEYLAVGEQRILTHCNAGWLAAVDWGTALSGIYHLQATGEKPSVWVDETRPRLQGARLTAWELQQQGIPCQIQADNAAAWMMKQGKVDAIVVGADRIAANGDVANKIGTYALSLAAKEHGVPMYVAAPVSTFDQQCATGNEIPIEIRDGIEVLEHDGSDEHGVMHRVSLATVGAQANNPAFDVTPFANVSGIVTEHGLWSPSV